MKVAAMIRYDSAELISSDPFNTGTNTCLLYTSSQILLGDAFQHQFGCKVLTERILEIIFIYREYNFGITERWFVLVGLLNIKRSQCRHPSVTVDNVGTPAKLLHCFQHLSLIHI